MAKKIDTSEYNRFSDVTDRLDEIIESVRAKDTSLERSLDLFDEAIALGTRAVDLVDKAAFSPEERERLVDAAGEDSAEAEAAAGKTSEGAELEAEPEGEASEVEPESTEDTEDTEASADNSAAE